MSGRRLAVATRGSALALAQARQVEAALRAVHRDLEIALVVVRTRGDDAGRAVAELGARGVFVREVEDAVLRGAADLAVHSYKDLPTALRDDLAVCATPLRGDPRDALVTVGGAGVQGLDREARVGTGSPRRRCQLLAARPDLRVTGARGNVDTRLAKLEAGEWDALVLAAAGLDRLGHRARRSMLDPSEFVPAPGQGALALQVRRDDAWAGQVAAAVHHVGTALEVETERAFLRALGGGCLAPVGALARQDGGRLTLRGFIGDLAGAAPVKGSLEGRSDRGEGLGERLAADLLERGADELLRRARESAGA